MTMSDTWNKVKSLLGFSEECRNNGIKSLRGECKCAKYYDGRVCENIICINNGTRIPSPDDPNMFVSCRCPHPEYISGKNCEILNCANGGKDSGSGLGNCKCLDNWYHGQFCQYYSAPWGVVLGAPVAFVILVVICCVVCRMDLCPRKRGARRRRRPLSSADATSTVHEIVPALDAPQPHTFRHELRLDALPVFNPSAVEGELKPNEPPPSYDEVIGHGERFPVSDFPTAPNRPERLPPIYSPPSDCQPTHSTNRLQRLPPAEFV